MERKTPRDWEKFKRESQARGLFRTFERICEYHHVDLKEAFLSKGTTRVTQARAQCFIWLRENQKFSHPEIGKLWQRDHTSSVSAVRRHKTVPRVGPWWQPSFTDYVGEIRLPAGSLGALEERVTVLEAKLAKLYQAMG